MECSGPRSRRWWGWPRGYSSPLLFGYFGLGATQMYGDRALRRFFTINWGVKASGVGKGPE